ncbi:MAG: ribosome small subunit-dependent GTPase A, partial [Candidatus Aminicenantales bacterium]
MVKLREYGWDNAFEAQFATCAERDLTPARVVRQLRDISMLVTVQGETPGEVSGRFRHTARGPADYPAVGDWAAVSLN